MFQYQAYAEITAFESSLMELAVLHWHALQLQSARESFTREATKPSSLGNPLLAPHFKLL